MTSKTNPRADVKKLYKELISKCSEEEKKMAYVAITAFLAGCATKKKEKTV